MSRRWSTEAIDLVDDGPVALAQRSQEDTRLALSLEGVHLVRLVLSSSAVHIRTLLGVLCAGALLGCGGAAESPPGADRGATDAGTTVEPDANADAGAGALDATATDASAEPALRFYSGPPDAPVAVTSIVYGAPISIRATGVEPGVSYTLRGELWGYRSEVQIVAGADGVIDTARDAPVGGDYDGVEAEGLVWSMKKLSDATSPSYDVTARLVRDQVELAAATLTRRPMGADAQMISVREEGLVGTLLVPRHGSPAPVVIVLGGSEGGLDSAELTAAYLSTFGVAAFALAYFGVPSLPPQLENIPLEYVLRGVRWLGRRTDIDPGQIYVMGGSRGSELALMVAATSTTVRGAIGLVPSSVRWSSVLRDDRAAWTYQGVGLPYVHAVSATQPTIETIDGRTGYRFTPVFNGDLDEAAPSDLEAARIRVEDIAGPVLLLGSADDALWPSCRFAERAMDSLVASGHPQRYADQRHCFPDAGHLVGPPGWPTQEAYAVWAEDLGEYMILGGTPKGTAHAERALYWILSRFFAAL